MFTLESIIGVVVPDTGQDSITITSDQLSDRVSIVESKLSYLFGGCSRFAGVGSYIGTHGVIGEGIVLCLSWSTLEAYQEHYDHILTWASYLARWWYQETIGVINNKLQLHLVSESDYILECTKTIIPPPDYLALLPDIPNETALTYWRNGYTVAGAQYEHDTQVIK